jgi:hypothetical protein
MSFLAAFEGFRSAPVTSLGPEKARRVQRDCPRWRTGGEAHSQVPLRVGSPVLSLTPYVCPPTGSATPQVRSTVGALSLVGTVTGRSCESSKSWASELFLTTRYTG